MSAASRPRRSLKAQSNALNSRPAPPPVALKPLSAPRKVVPPRPPSAQKQPIFIRKRVDGGSTPEKTLPSAKRLPSLQPKCTIQPPSPYFGNKALLDPEDLCLPYELDDKPRFIKKPSRPIEVQHTPLFHEKMDSGSRFVNVSILSDMEQGSLDKSELDLPSTNASFVDKAGESRSVSPITTSRSRKIRQLSKCFVLSKRELERRVEGASWGHSAKGRKVEPEEQMPQIMFMSDLEDVLRVPSAFPRPPHSVAVINPSRRLY